MKARFHALLDALTPQLPASVVYLSVGNEVDDYLAGHPDEWSSYKNFFEDAMTYIHQKTPWVKVGVTVTFDGALGPQTSNVANLTGNSDVLVFTYYPLGPNYHPRDPQSPAIDFPRMLALAGQRPVILQEVGYPSSLTLGSSESQQAEFVSSVFQSWGLAGSGIPFLNYFLLHDVTDSACDQFATYYGAPSDQSLHQFLCSVGLREADGTPKLGWQAFVDSASQAGFPN
jgi:hypothetical protein